MDTSRKARIGRPSAEDSAAIEARILDTAWSLIQAEGAAGLSMNRIAEAAGISKKTIYTRFEDKPALLVKLIERQLGAAVDAWRVRSQGGSFRDALRRTAEHVLAYMTSHDCTVLMALAREIPGAEAEVWRACYTTGLATVDELLRHPDATAALSAFDPQVFRHAWLQSLIGRAEIVVRLKDPQPRDNAEWAAALTDLYLGRAPGPRSRRAVR